MVIHNLQTKFRLIFAIVHTRDLKENISICSQSHYSTQRLSLADRPCVRIRSFSTMSIHSIMLCIQRQN